MGLGHRRWRWRCKCEQQIAGRSDDEMKQGGIVFFTQSRIIRFGEKRRHRFGEKRQQKAIVKDRAQPRRPNMLIVGDRRTFLYVIE